MYTVWTYLVYLVVSIAVTVWVAHTLHKNGRVFLVQAFRGHEKLADSVNELLVVGFYLINVGYVTLALKYGAKPVNLQQSIEFFSTKIGLVLLVLGLMHFFNILVFSLPALFARQHLRASEADLPPPVEPDAQLAAQPV